MCRTESARAAPYQLRACTETDAAFVLALTETVMRAHTERTWGRWDPAYHLAEFHRAFGRLDHSIIVFGGTAAGYLAVHHRDDAVYLQWLLLLPEYQRRGIGSAILTDLIRATTAAGRPLQLRVLPINIRAQHLYARFGFVITGTIDEFVCMEHRAGAAARRT
jgi:ribosomal protein S18 acetylase RimI-like enzyme